MDIIDCRHYCDLEICLFANKTIDPYTQNKQKDKKEQW